MADFRQITVSSAAAVPLVTAGEGSVLLSNTDANNTVWVSDDRYNTTTDPGTSAPLPALGTLVVDGTTDLFGICPAGQTAAVTKIPGGSLFFQLLEIIVKTLILKASAGNGLFEYTGTPALGNPPIASITPGTADPYGNPVQKDIVSYLVTAGVVKGIAQLTGGMLLLGPIPAGGGSLAAIAGTLTGGQLTFDSGMVSGTDTGAAMRMNSASYGAAKGMYVGPSNLGKIGAADLETILFGLQSRAAPATPPANLVYGYCDTNGRIRAKGTSGADVPLYGNDGLNLMSALGFANSWASGARVAAQYRFWYGNEVELIGSLVVPAGFAAGQTVVSLPAGPPSYRPANPQSIGGFDTTTHQAIDFTLGSAGTFAFQGPAANTAAGNTIDFHGYVSLDA